MAEIITALWLSSLLYGESGAAALLGPEALPPKSILLLFAGLFTALEFVIGHVGSNLASEGVLVRLLCPQRYFRTRSFFRLAVKGLTTSATIPLQTAIHRVQKQFIANGLFKGSEEGDMFETVFFEDKDNVHGSFH